MNQKTIKTQPIKQHLEILPANLISRKREWQKMGRSLPMGSALLITDPQNKKQDQFMLRLARSFKSKGRQVVILSVGDAH